MLGDQQYIFISRFHWLSMFWFNGTRDVFQKGPREAMEFGDTNKV